MIIENVPIGGHVAGIGVETIYDPEYKGLYCTVCDWLGFDDELVEDDSFGIHCPDCGSTELEEVVMC